MCVCVCVCERERERFLGRETERERKSKRESERVCVRERERERDHPVEAEGWSHVRGREVCPVLARLHLPHATPHFKTTPPQNSEAAPRRARI